MQPVFRAYPGRIRPAAITRTAGQILSIQLSTAFWGSSVRLLNAAGRGGAEVAATIAIRHDLAATISGAGAINTQLSTGFAATVAATGGIAADVSWGIGLGAIVGGASSAGGTLGINHALASVIVANGAIFADLSVAAYAITLHMRDRLINQSGELLESPIRQQAGDQISYLIAALSDMGGSKNPIGTIVTRESTGTDVTTTALVGVLGVTGGKLSLPRLGPLTAGEIYRVNSQFSMGGNVVNVFFRVVAE